MFAAKEIISLPALQAVRLASAILKHPDAVSVCLRERTSSGIGLMLSVDITLLSGETVSHDLTDYSSW